MVLGTLCNSKIRQSHAMRPLNPPPCHCYQNLPPVCRKGVFTLSAWDSISRRKYHAGPSSPTNLILPPLSLLPTLSSTAIHLTHTDGSRAKRQPSQPYLFFLSLSLSILLSFLYTHPTVLPRFPGARPCATHLPPLALPSPFDWKDGGGMHRAMRDTRKIYGA